MTDSDFTLNDWRRRLGGGGAVLYAEGLFSREFPTICNHCGVMTAWSRKTWKFCEQFSIFFGKNDPSQTVAPKICPGQPPHLAHTIPHFIQIGSLSAEPIKCSIRCWDAAVVQMWLCSMCKDHCSPRVICEPWTAIYGGCRSGAIVGYFCDSEVLVCFHITLISDGVEPIKNFLGSLSLAMTPRHRTLIFTLHCAESMSFMIWFLWAAC